MSTAPSGTVTFLFTDIEGSTKLAQRYPGAMPGLLSRHHQILYQMIEANNGYTFQVVGDSIAAAFHSAGDAARAAIEAQQCIQTEAWSPEPIRVRMGLHTGAAELNPSSSPTVYSSYAVIALAQRIMSAGHGGQILVSGATRQLLQDASPSESELIDLGAKRLKDSPRPERLYQLIAPGLQAHFPPLRTLDSRPNNLPVQLTSFIGREDQIAEVRQKLVEHRLVTLTGSGGTGKTRLSLEVAAQLLESFEHGVWFIELAPLSDPEQIPNAIITEMRLSAQTGRPPLDVLKDYLRGRSSLLILDNCEHVIEACSALVDTLLAAAPRLKVLASSREALGVRGELNHPVPSLSMPDASQVPPIEELTRYESVGLFLDRARLVAPDFDADAGSAPYLAQICRRLDGIPLAIELAAARVRMLSVKQIAARLDDRFRLLTGGARTALPRQQTLRALIDWSYDILPDRERLLFRRLAVFAGGWSLEAAEAVCSEEGLDPYEVLDALAQLVNKSLVVVVEDVPVGGSRYRMLETIRQYALEKLLQAGGGEAVRDRHLDYYLDVVKRAEPEFFGPRELYWMDWLRAEADNLHTAVEWSLQSRPVAGLELINSLGYFLLDHFHIPDEESWLSELLAHPANAARTARRARGLITLAWSIGMGREDLAPGPALLDEALSIYRELDHRNGMAHAYHAHGIMRFSLGTPGEGIRYLESALELYRETNDRPWIAHTLQFLGFSLGSYESERKMASLREGLGLYRELGYVSGIIEVLKQLGAAEIRLGNFDAAHAWLDEGLSILEQNASSLGYSKIMSYDLGDLAFHEGRYELAREHYADALAWAERIVSPVSLDYARVRMGALLARMGDVEAADRHLREAVESFWKMGSTAGLVLSLDAVASLAVAAERWEKAAMLYAYTSKLHEDADDPRPVVEQALVDRDLDLVRAALDGPSFEASWHQGRELTPEQAFQLVLED